MKLKLFTSFLFTVLFISLIRAQTTETFESQTGGAASFTSNGQPFTLTRSLQMQRSHPL